MVAQGLRETIACFDLATQTGVAVGLVGFRPELETWDLRGPETRAEKLNRFDGYLESLIIAKPVQRLFYEAPLPIAVLMEIGAREETVQMLRSLAAMVEACAARHDLPVGTWAVQKARRSVTGYGTFKRGDAKRMVMRYCKLLGHAPANDNEADALVGHIYESALLNPRTAYLSTPLFAAR